MDRLDLTHEVFTRAIGNLHLAPIDVTKTHRVLDMGTGTGVCTFAGVTLSPPPRSPLPHVFPIADVHCAQTGALDFADRHPGIEVCFPPG